jgi:hypothetical protein
MKLRRKFAALLAFIMAFSSLASFSALADTAAPSFMAPVPMSAGTLAFGGGAGIGAVTTTEGGSPTNVIVVNLAGWAESGVANNAAVEITVTPDVVAGIIFTPSANTLVIPAAGTGTFNVTVSGTAAMGHVGTHTATIRVSQNQDGTVYYEEIDIEITINPVAAFGLTVGAAINLQHGQTAIVNRDITAGPVPAGHIAQLRVLNADLPPGFSGAFGPLLTVQTAAPGVSPTLNIATPNPLPANATTTVGSWWIDFETQLFDAGGTPVGAPIVERLAINIGGPNLAPALTLINPTQSTITIAAGEVVQIPMHALNAMPVVTTWVPVSANSAIATGSMTSINANANTLTVTGIAPGTTDIVVTVSAPDPANEGQFLLSSATVTVNVLPMDAELANILLQRPHNHIPGRYVSGLVDNTNFRWTLYDRGIALDSNRPNPAPAPHGVTPPAIPRDAQRPIAVAPELVIPSTMLSAQGGMVTLRLEGWGPNPWSTAWGTTYARVPEFFPADPTVGYRTAGQIFRGGPVAGSAWLGQPLNHHGSLDRLPNARDAGFSRYTVTGEPDIWYFSGLRSTNPTPTFHELPIAFRFDGQYVHITYPPMPAIQVNSVLRFPLIAQGTDANFTATPTLTLVSGIFTPAGAEITETELPYVRTGAGVVATVSAVGRGRNFVDVNSLRISSAAGTQAFIGGGQIVFTLPLGYRWDPAAEITLGGVALDGAVWIPSNAYGGAVARDGNAAESIMVLQLPPGPLVNLPGTLSQVVIDGLSIRPSVGSEQQIQFGDVHVSISTGANTPLNWFGTDTQPTPTLNRTTVNLMIGAGGTVVNGAVGPNSWMAAARPEGNVISAFQSITGTPLHIGTFADFSVTFNRMSGGAGNISTIVAGWLPAEGGGTTGAGAVRNTPMHDRVSGRNQTSGAASFANVASVRFEEFVPNSAWGAHSLTFTVVTAEGERHPYVSIRNVNFAPGVFGVTLASGTAQDAGTINIPASAPGGARTEAAMPSRVAGNFVNSVGGARGTETGGGSVIFAEDGRAVTASGLRLNQHIWNNGMLRMDAHFGLTADVNFEGPVYIAVTDLGQALGGGQGTDFGVIDLAPVQVAYVRRAIEVEADSTEVQVGFQTVQVADVIIREMEPGDFRTNSEIIVALGEYGTGQIAGYSNIHFIPIPTLQAPHHITIGGASSPANQVRANLRPFHSVAASLSVAISQSTRGAEPSYIHLHGLNVRIVRDVPFGQYELVVRGSSILNNENFAFDQIAPGGDFNVRTEQRGTVTHIVHLRPFDQGFRRYGHGPLMMERFIYVMTPGAGAGTEAQARIAIPHAPGTTFLVNGEERTFADANGNPVTTVNLGAPQTVNMVEVPANRLFVPVRGVIEALGGSIVFHMGNMFEGVPHRIQADLGDTTVFFVIGHPFYNINGMDVPMMTGGVPFAPFIGDGTVGSSGTTYLPLRYIVNAFGLDLNDSLNGHAVINPESIQYVPQ